MKLEDVAELDLEQAEACCPGAKNHILKTLAENALLQADHQRLVERAAQSPNPPMITGNTDELKVRREGRERYVQVCSDCDHFPCNCRIPAENILVESNRLDHADNNRCAVVGCKKECVIGSYVCNIHLVGKMGGKISMVPREEARAAAYAQKPTDLHQQIKQAINTKPFKPPKIATVSQTSQDINARLEVIREVIEDIDVRQDCEIAKLDWTEAYEACKKEQSAIAETNARDEFNNGLLIEGEGQCTASEFHKQTYFGVKPEAQPNVIMGVDQAHDMADAFAFSMHSMAAAERREQERRTTTGSAIDPNGIVHPAHYNQHPTGVECIDIIEHFTFNISSAMKYCWRHGLKPGEDAAKDLEKAAYQLQREARRIRGEYPTYKRNV